MKKISVLLLAALSVALFASQAQAQGVTIGIKGGLNFASATIKSTDTDMPEFETQTGLIQGIFINFKLGPIAIQPELLYSRMGTKWVDYEGEEGTATGYIRSDYLELPILVKYSFLSGPVKPFVMAGPSISYLLSNKWGYEYDYTDPIYTDYSYSYDYKDYYKKLDFAGVIAIGVDYKLPKFVVSLEARYHLGLANVINSDMLEESTTTSIKNRAFSVLIGIGF
jgi:hypothetical protein